MGWKEVKANKKSEHLIRVKVREREQELASDANASTANFNFNWAVSSYIMFCRQLVGSQQKMTPSTVGELRGRSQGTNGADGAAGHQLKKKKKKLEPWLKGAHRGTVDQSHWQQQLQPRNCGCIIWLCNWLSSKQQCCCHSSHTQFGNDTVCVCVCVDTVLSQTREWGERV